MAKRKMGATCTLKKRIFVCVCVRDPTSLLPSLPDPPPFGFRIDTPLFGLIRLELREVNSLAQK